MEKKTENHPFLIDCDFPGGNIVIDKIDQNTVYVHQDQRDTAVFWFYWCFRIRGAGSQTLNFVFTHGDVFGTRGPAVSLDAGQTWEWLGSGVVIEFPQGFGFSYRFANECHEVRFCFAIPYLESHLNAFTAAHAGNSHMAVDTLCRTRKGRLVEILHLGNLDGNPAHRVLLASRHHACESVATYALEGLMAAVLADTSAGQWLRKNVEFFIVPFMDKDGVEEGDQGKLRVPRDHNRDYQGESIYPETKALRRMIPQWSEDKLRIAIDMHCPYIKGEGHEDVYFVGGPDQQNWERVLAFSRILENCQTGILLYRVADNLPYGQAWNTSDATEGKSFGRWAAEQTGIWVGTSIEIPYANVREQAVTAEAARAFGRDLAQAIYILLRDGF